MPPRTRADRRDHGRLRLLRVRAGASAARPGLYGHPVSEVAAGQQPQLYLRRGQGEEVDSAEPCRLHHRTVRRAADPGRAGPRPTVGELGSADPCRDRAHAAGPLGAFGRHLAAEHGRPGPTCRSPTHGNGAGAPPARRRLRHAQGPPSAPGRPECGRLTHQARVARDDPLDVAGRAQKAAAVSASSWSRMSE